MYGGRLNAHPARSSLSSQAHDLHIKSEDLDTAVLLFFPPRRFAQDEHIHGTGS